MSAFDDLTLGEVEVIESTCLNGKGMGDDANNPLTVAGGVMWITQRRDDAALTWDDFKNRTKMGDIKTFSESMQDDAEDPTHVPSA